MGVLEIELLTLCKVLTAEPSLCRAPLSKFLKQVLTLSSASLQPMESSLGWSQTLSYPPASATAFQVVQG